MSDTPSPSPTPALTTVPVLSSKALNMVAMSMVVLGVLGYVGMATYLSQHMVGEPHLPDYLILQGDVPEHNIWLPVSVPDSLSSYHVKVLDPQAHMHIAHLNDMMYNRNPVLLVWVTLVSIMVAFALACLPLFWAVIGRLIKDGLPHGAVRIRACVAVFIASCLILLPVGSVHFWSANDVVRLFKILLGTEGSLLVPVGLTLTGAGVGITAMLSIGARAVQLGDGVTNGQLTMDQLSSKLKGLTALLRFTLGALAVLIAFAVLTSGALRESIIHTVKVDGLDIMPIEFVRMYGLFFTAILAIVYIPIHLQLRSVAELVKQDDTGDVAAGTKPGYLSAIPWNDLKAAIAVLLPLISGFLPEQLHGLIG